MKNARPIPGNSFDDKSMPPRDARPVRIGRATRIGYFLFIVWLAVIIFANRVSFEVPLPVIPTSMNVSVGNALLYVFVLVTPLLVIRPWWRTLDPNVFAIVCLASALVLITAVGALKSGGAVPARYVITGMAGVLTLWVAAQVIRDIGGLTLILRTWCIFAVILAGMLLLGTQEWAHKLPGYISGQPGLQFGRFQFPFERQVSFSVGPDTATIWLASALALLLNDILNHQTILANRRRLLFLGMFLIAAALVVLQSRASYLTAATVIWIVVVWAWSARLPNFTRTAMRLSGVVLFMFAAVGTAIMLNLTSPGTEWERNLSDRGNIATIVVEELRRSPAIGGSTAGLEPFGGHAHNAYLQVLLLGGPVALMTLLVFCGATLVLARGRAVRAYPLATGLFASLVGALVQNLFYVGVYEKVFYLVVAFCVIVASQRRWRDADAGLPQKALPVVPIQRWPSRRGAAS